MSSAYCTLSIKNDVRWGNFISTQFIDYMCTLVALESAKMIRLSCEYFFHAGLDQKGPKIF